MISGSAAEGCLWTDFADVRIAMQAAWCKKRMAAMPVLPASCHVYVFFDGGDCFTKFHQGQ